MSSFVEQKKVVDRWSFFKLSFWFSLYLSQPVKHLNTHMESVVTLIYWVSVSVFNFFFNGLIHFAVCVGCFSESAVYTEVYVLWIFIHNVTFIHKMLRWWMIGFANDSCIWVAQGLALSTCSRRISWVLLTSVWRLHVLLFNMSHLQFSSKKFCKKNFCCVSRTKNLFRNSKRLFQFSLCRGERELLYCLIQCQMFDNKKLCCQLQD